MDVDSFNTSIDSLPFELIEIIFKHLDIKSLVKCCVVSKKWKLIIEQLKIQELQIENKFDKYCIPGHFFYTRNRVDAKNIAENFDARQIGTFRLNLSNLKRLMISSKWDKTIRKGAFDEVAMTPLYIEVQELNKFTELEQLKVDGICVGGLENRMHLPKLKILDLWHPNGTLVMDLPCLKALNCHNLKRVHLVNPKTVDFIKVCTIEHGDTSVFADYENVTRLKLDHVLDIRENNNILRNLPNLLIFDGDQETKYKSQREQHYYTYNLVNKLYNSLRKQKQMLKRETLRLCFGQIEIEDNKRFEDYEDFRDYFDC